MLSYKSISSRNVDLFSLCVSYKYLAAINGTTICGRFY